MEEFYNNYSKNGALSDEALEYCAYDAAILAEYMGGKHNKGYKTKMVTFNQSLGFRFEDWEHPTFVDGQDVTSCDVGNN